MIDNLSSAWVSSIFNGFSSALFKISAIRAAFIHCWTTAALCKRLVLKLGDAAKFYTPVRNHGRSTQAKTSDHQVTTSLEIDACAPLVVDLIARVLSVSWSSNLVASNVTFKRSLLNFVLIESLFRIGSLRWWPRIQCPIHDRFSVIISPTFQSSF